MRPLFVTHVSAPANIALIKYWGKKEQQIPLNPSLSLTLNECQTQTQLSVFEWEQGEDKNHSLNCEYFFEDKRREDFELKVTKILLKWADNYSALRGKKYVFQSRNTFPHSAGIASSASSMAALAKAVSGYLSSCQITLTPPEVSSLARMASGSACRSLEGGYQLWGKVASLNMGEDTYAMTLAEDLIHPTLRKIYDTVCVISSADKATSSTEGHQRMKNHPFAVARIEQAQKNMVQLLDALKSGEIPLWGQIIEEEALTLHSLMLTSNPSTILLKPATLAAIEKIRLFRLHTQLPLYFTLDAGPNLHLLYPDSQTPEELNRIRSFIKKDLAPLVESQSETGFIWDYADGGLQSKKPGP